MPTASLSLILPTLNERENIERFVPDLLSEVSSIMEIVVVDDDSSDGTPEAVERLALTDDRIRLIRRLGPPSLTESIRSGISASRGELIGWMDADLVMAPRDLARLVEAVGQRADVAVGSRFAPGGRIKGQRQDGLFGRLLALRNLRTTEDSWLGVLLSWALNGVFLPALVGAGVRDYTSGIVVAKRAVLDDIHLRGHHGEYFIHLWAALLASGARVVEVPYRVRPRMHGRSKTGNDLGDYLARGQRYFAAGIGAGAVLRDAGRKRRDGSSVSFGGAGARRTSSSANRTSR